MSFFFSFLFGPLLVSNLITFLFLIHLKQFKVLQECHLTFFKLFWTSNKIRTTYKLFFECSGIGLCMVQWIDFLKFLTLSTLGDHNFLNSISFLDDFQCAKCANGRGSSFVWIQKNNGALPLEACTKHLNVQSSTDLPSQ